MAPEVDPPEQQAAEALREAVRRIDAEREFIQGQPGPNEAFEKLLANPVDPDALREVIRELDDPADKCGQGLGCDCPFHSMHEIELRQRRRALVDADGWSLAPGECTGCGLDDQPVKGPAGAELCRYCDGLRIMAPRHAAPGWPVTLLGAARMVTRDIGMGRLNLSLGMVIWALGIFLLTSGYALQGAMCFVVVMILWSRGRP